MIIWCCLLSAIFNVVCGELAATSTRELVRVLEGEDDLLKDLDIYMDALEEKLNVINVLVEDHHKRLQEADLDPVAFASNPLNSFPMMRRMHQDAPKLLHFLKTEEGEDLQQIADYKLEVISDLDLEYAAMGLLRIMDVYLLEEDDIAKGLLFGKQYNETLDTLDCISIARHLKIQGENQQAIKWLEIALKHYENTPEIVLQSMKSDRNYILSEMELLKIY